MVYLIICQILYVCLLTIQQGILERHQLFENYYIGKIQLAMVEANLYQDVSNQLESFEQSLDQTRMKLMKDLSQLLPVTNLLENNLDRDILYQAGQSETLCLYYLYLEIEPEDIRQLGRADEKSFLALTSLTQDQSQQAEWLRQTSLDLLELGYQKVDDYQLSRTGQWQCLLSIDQVINFSTGWVENYEQDSELLVLTSQVDQQDFKMKEYFPQRKLNYTIYGYGEKWQKLDDPFD